jgi:glycosidase
MKASSRPIHVLLGLVLLAPSSATRAQGPAPVPAEPPAWAKDAVYYLIHPDRFRNGDPRNDPKVADLRGAWPYEVPRDWRLSPWTADWYKLQPWEKATGRSFSEIVPMRRYGGDLQGILERLDHVQGLGATAILLEPIFEAPSAARRDAASLHHVDNNLGPDPEGDRLLWATENPSDPATWKWSAADRLFLRLVQECHRRQMKVVLDGVFDHVGATFWAFRDVRSRGRSSRLASWFSVGAFDDPRTPDDELEYAAAEGVREWPELRRDGDTLAAGPRDYIRAIVRRWSDPNGDGDPTDGVDGWRLAAVERLPRGFVRELRRWVTEANPEGLLADQTASDSWAQAVRTFFVDRQNAVTPSAFDAALAAIRDAVPPASGLALLNSLEDHRSPRLASQIVNPDRTGAEPSPSDDPKYDLREPRPEEWRRLRMMAAFQFASPGAPVLRYGIEAGMWAPAPDKPMLWRELTYEKEAAHPLGQQRKPDPVKFDDDLLEFFQTLGKLRATQPALRLGSTETVLADDQRRVFVFARTLESDRVVAAFNASDKDAVVELPAPALEVRDLLSGRRLQVRDEKVQATLPAQGAVYLAADTR